MSNCRVMVYCPESRLWQQVAGQKLTPNQVCAIVHEPKSPKDITAQVRHVWVDQRQTLLPFYIEDKSLSSLCESCQAIKRKLSHIRDMERRHTDVS